MEDSILKNKWIAARNKNLVTIDLIVEYAIHRGVTLTLNKIMLGLQFCNMHMIIDDIDHYFEAHVLEDRDDNFIKIVQ